MIGGVILVTLAMQTSPIDPRYCGSPIRDEKGKIRRSTLVIAEFKQIHPCPANGLREGPCKGWAIDHVVPLACGGCDSVGNMQWLPGGYKIRGKDRWERKVYSLGLPDTKNCVNEIIKESP